MPKTENSLRKLIIEQNIIRTHHRGLNEEYGYNHILHANLVDECIKLYNLKKSKIRVLDIGCGDGYALSEMKSEIKQKGLGDKFEFYGMGFNLYDKMYIPRSHFIKKGTYSYKPRTKLFDLIISVYTFQYIWHKLEILEHIYNYYMSDNAKAIIHFPGYLVKFSEESSELLQCEADGNRSFFDFIKQWNSCDKNPQLKHSIIPYYSDFNSDDDEQTLFTEFGNLKFQKEKNKKLNFKTSLSAFGIYDEGFIFSNLDKKLSYVLSVYNKKPTTNADISGSDQTAIHSNMVQDVSVCRIVTLSKEYKERSYNFHLGVHHLKSNVIIGIYPAVKEDMTGYAIPYREIAESLQEQNVGAVVRCNGLYDPLVDFQEFNDVFVRSFIEYILENSKSICGHSKPKIYLMGYSAGGSAIASVAAEYDSVKKLLLIAPSYDSGKAALKKSMNNYCGELYIVAAGRDKVVLPYQVAWFYYQAKKAKLKKFVELSSCEHYFVCLDSKKVVSKAPFWAFNGSKDFPREQLPSYEYEDEAFWR